MIKNISLNKILANLKFKNFFNKLKCISNLILKLKKI